MDEDLLTRLKKILSPSTTLFVNKAESLSPPGDVRRTNASVVKKAKGSFSNRVGNRETRRVRWQLRNKVKGRFVSASLSGASGEMLRFRPDGPHAPSGERILPRRISPSLEARIAEDSSKTWGSLAGGSDGPSETPLSACRIPERLSAERLGEILGRGLAECPRKELARGCSVSR